MRTNDMLEALNPAAQWRKACALGMFASRLVIARRNIESNLRELLSLRSTCERISTVHAEGHNLLCKCCAEKAEGLHEKTQGCARQYQRLLAELKSAPSLSATEWPSEFCEIDLTAVEEVAKTEGKMMARKMGDLAHAEMLIAFDHKEEALEILKPYLESEGEPAEE